MTYQHFASHPERNEAIEVELNRIRWGSPLVVTLVRPLPFPRRALVAILPDQRHLLYPGRLVVVRDGGSRKHEKACVEWMNEVLPIIARVRYVDWDASSLYEDLGKIDL
jgi:hypothetical protein